MLDNDSSHAARHFNSRRLIVCISTSRTSMACGSRAMKAMHGDSPESKLFIPARSSPEKAGTVLVLSNFACRWNGTKINMQSN
ncbi:hypothetical protein TELCIR_20618 [Teladorsagia circumcincta]|uniref:Uncharacterized protein n=1 Tax=Teladorsagia circumcincta TaxID=45464 RepID=A0A2G9TJ04_TELCI|nr:hypothetical protein TELCIR_20618 [Teladorsagia circumcincta]